MERRVASCWAALGLVLVAAGCTGYAHYLPDASSDARADGDQGAGSEQGVDGSQGQDQGAVHDAPREERACSASGVPATCDPVAPSGCAEGDCYATRDGLVCVCPAGTNPSLTSCSTTTECAPGHVCAGTAPPGTCRQTCDPQAPQCGAGESCIVIEGYTDVGFCQ